MTRSLGITASAVQAALTPMKIRIPSLTGGSSISAADTTNLRVPASNDRDFLMDVSLDAWDGIASFRRMICKGSANTNNDYYWTRGTSAWRSYRGTATFGSDVTWSAVVSAGTRIRLRWQLTYSTGMTIAYSTDTTTPLNNISSWTSIGTTGVASRAPVNDTQRCYLMNDVAGSLGCVGYFYEFILRGKDDPATIYARCEATKFQPGVTSYTDAYGNTWRLDGSASSVAQ